MVSCLREIALFIFNIYVLMEKKLAKPLSFNIIEISLRWKELKNLNEKIFNKNWIINENKFELS
jgi:hypothetical protein